MLVLIKLEDRVLCTKDCISFHVSFGHFLWADCSGFSLYSIVFYLFVTNLWEFFEYSKYKSFMACMWRKLSTEVLVLLNCGVGEDSWQSLGVQGDPTSPFWRSALDFFGRNDAKAETPVLWPPHAKSWLIGKDSDAGRDWGQEEEGMTEDEMAGWHHWLRWTWVWVNSGSWWWTGRPGVLRFMESQRVGHDWATELIVVPPSVQFHFPQFQLSMNGKLQK